MTREHEELSRLWSQASLLPSQSACLPLYKRPKERKTITVGPDAQHQTLKSALSQAADYDRILIHPGLYQRIKQNEMN